MKTENITEELNNIRLTIKALKETNVCMLEPETGKDLLTTKLSNMMTQGKIEAYEVVLEILQTRIQAALMSEKSKRH